ncbi:MAG: DNA repair protein RadC [Bacteroidia bacterium]|nr:DNA repair protein RadC [Bacteroidia bacterium]
MKQLSSIKSWAEEDRPREKFLLKGKSSLSDAELIAILLGSGSVDESAVGLAKRLLAGANNNLNDLAQISLTDLQKLKGIGEAKAITIAAALELGRRRKDADVRERPRIQTSREAYQLVCDKLIDLDHEEFWVAYLNRSSRVLKEENISRGGISGTVVDVKLIMKSALEYGASSLVLFHNHPSGNSDPSQEDHRLTRKIADAARFFDISVSDHLIIYENKYTSFADEGFL